MDNINESVKPAYSTATKDKYTNVVKTIDSWRLARKKGSITVYMDGSGCVVRYTETTEGK